MKNNEKTPGKFVVIEGIDGAGTTTQSGMLVDWLTSRGLAGALTSEPSGGPIGSLLRQILKGRTIARDAGGNARPIHNDAIALLFAADRMDHLDSEILPLLAGGVNVVSDRYYHSSFTYQSLQGDLEWIRVLNGHARQPDTTYLLHCTAEEAGMRMARRRISSELYEVLETQKRLEVAYRELAACLSEEVVIIDGTGSIQEVHRSITSDLSTRFGW